jgi:hypothetical protein
MKYLMIAVMSIAIACNSHPKTEAKPTEAKSDGIPRDPITGAPIKMTNFDSCKLLHERIMSYAEKVDMKQMAKKEAKKKTDSLQKILYKLRDNLNLQQRKELSDYAMKMFNEMVDRKVLRDNPKP